MRVLVTGGAGFIGSHVVEQLLARGDDVHVLDDLSRGKRTHVPKGVPLHVLDICSDQAAACMEAVAPEAVIHLAAQMDVGASMRAPVQDAHTNVLGTLNVLHAAARAGTQSFVAASSGGALYGDTETFPTDEGAPCAPQSPYGASKQCTEIYLGLMDRSTSMRCISLRLSNVYGPRQSHVGEAGVVAIFAERMLRNLAPVINGDGAQSRDFVYVQDVARAFLGCLEATTPSGAYNVATSIATTLLQLAALIAQATHFSGALQFAPAKLGEVRRSALAWQRLHAACGWAPAQELAAGIAATVEALRSAGEAAEAAPALAAPRPKSRRSTRKQAVPDMRPS